MTYDIAARPRGKRERDLYQRKEGGLLCAEGNFQGRDSGRDDHGNRGGGRKNPVKVRGHSLTLQEEKGGEECEIERKSRKNLYCAPQRSTFDESRGKKGKG